MNSAFYVFSNSAIIICFLSTVYFLLASLSQGKRMRNLKSAGIAFIVMLVLTLHHLSKLTPETIAVMESQQKKQAAMDIKYKKKLDDSTKNQIIDCLEDLDCSRQKDMSEIKIQCQPAIENLAKHDFKWINGWGEQVFSARAWKNRNRAIITHQGDSIKMQNGFGAWTRMIYDCDFDHKRRVAVAVRVREY
jgi:hypothetical protein